MDYTSKDITRIRESMKLDQTDFAPLLGVSRELLNKMESGKRGISKATKVLLKRVEDQNKSEQSTENVPGEEDVANPTSLEAILKLIDANKILAQSQKNFSEANKKLADTNERLSLLLEKRESTAFVPQQIPEAVSSMLAGLQEVVMKIAMGERFETTNEVAALLYKVYPDQIPKVSAKGTQKG